VRESLYVLAQSIAVQLFHDIDNKSVDLAGGAVAVWTPLLFPRAALRLEPRLVAPVLHGLRRWPVVPCVASVQDAVGAADRAVARPLLSQ
jgi:hypothetical protein